MIVFRLCRSKYSLDLSGKGAELSGGRWNSKGTPLIYTSESRALCLAEVAVNISLALLPDDFKMVSIYIPDKVKIVTIKSNELPSDWNNFPHPHSTQIIGDKFISDKKNHVLKVPSVVVPGEFNFLINPLLVSEFAITVQDVDDFRFDGRFGNKPSSKLRLSSSS